MIPITDGPALPKLKKEIAMPKVKKPAVENKGYSNSEIWMEISTQISTDMNIKIGLKEPLSDRKLSDAYIELYTKLLKNMIELTDIK